MVNKSRLIAENSTSNKEAAVKRYKELTQLDESIKLTEANIDPWALSKACHEFCASTYDVRHALISESMLNEDSVDQAARQLDAEVTAANDKSELENKLDDCLERAKEIEGEEGANYPNLLIVGIAGMAKTAIVKQWARKNNINLYAIDAGKLQPEDLGGIVGYDPDDAHYSVKLGNREVLEELSKPNTVIFLDEYNRAKPNIRSTLLKLVQDHVLPSGRGDKFLPTVLFTIAAINPPSIAYEVNELDDAELSRFDQIEITPDPLQHLKYLNSYFDKYIEKAKAAGNEKTLKRRMGQKALANAILNDPRFEYSSLASIESGKEIGAKSTNYRSFQKALEASDGTKENLLKVWNDSCDFRQKKTIEDILKDFKDIDDKANAALKGGSKSKIFQKTLTNMEKIQKLLNNN